MSSNPTPFLLNEDDIDILPARQAECNAYKGYVLVIDTKTPCRNESLLNPGHWLPKDDAEKIKQQILSSLKLQRLVEDEDFKTELEIFVDSEGRMTTIEFKVFMYNLHKLLEESRKK